MAMMMVMLRMMVMGIYNNDNDNKYNIIDKRIRYRYY